MEYLRFVAFHVADFLRFNRFWMTWNLILAAIPALLAVALFARPRRRGALWWTGVVAFVLFLPNAPYVVTDLVHLSTDMDRAPDNGVVLVGVLPTYALFVALGIGCYVVAIELVVRELRRHRPGLARLPVELAIHAVCTIGVILGRITRLNSWDTVANPRWAIESSFNTFTWRGAPLAFVAIYSAIALATWVVRTLGRSIFDAGRALAARWQHRSEVRPA
jgi:uncharacterized membrane protein